jgi:ribonuclease Z
MHLDDLLERADGFRNELIILAHLSTRTHVAEARRRLEQQLPERLRTIVRLWSQEEL